MHLRAITGKPLLFSQGGDGLLFDVSHARGKMLFSTFAFDRDETDWVLHPSFVPFLDAALQYLRPQPQLSQTLEPGEIWLASFPPGTRVTTAVLRDGAGKPMNRTPVDNDLHRATLRAPDAPGIYALTYDADPTPRQMLSVNPSLKESDLRYLTGTPDVLGAWTLASAPVVAANEPVMALPAMSAAAQQILWWKLLFVGSLALVVEMIWQAGSGRRT